MKWHIYFSSSTKWIDTSKQIDGQMIAARPMLSGIPGSGFRSWHATDRPTEESTQLSRVELFRMVDHH